METTIHNQIKSVISIVVGAIILREIWGRTFVDRMRFVHPITGVSHEPDGIFVSTTSLESGRVTVKGGDRAVVLSGSPDMALEVVSKSSAKKDLKTAMVEYAKAGISEYWVVDSRSNNPELAIYRLVNDEYVAARKMGGWMKSKVLGRSFRLTSKKGPQDVTFFDLETK